MGATNVPTDQHITSRSNEECQVSLINIPHKCGIGPNIFQHYAPTSSNFSHGPIDARFAMSEPAPLFSAVTY